MTASLNNASIRWHYQNGQYAVNLMQAAGLDELASKLPAEVVAMGEVIGELTTDAAAALGLPAGLPVVQGGADAFVAMVGLGVVSPGALAMITGSSHLHLGLSDHAFHGSGVWGTYADAVVRGLHVIEGGQTSTGSVINWFRELVGLDKSDYAELNDLAAALPPGAEGLIVQEHFQGNRTPHTDPRSRGVISGLTLKHRREHIFRAVIEGVAYGTELIFQTMRQAGYSPEQIIVCGGATNSPLWLQIHADVSGLPLTLTKVADAPALGSAILASVGSGHYADMAQACAQMVHVERTIEPDMANHQAYQDLFDLYQQTYPAMKPIVHRQADLA
jgi:ribulose kinase